tara:strand:- start:471 stop:620 length:150 start_codon:yes stop_codon:yes gene_type:complete
MEFLKDFFKFMLERKKFWLFPVFIFALIFSALIIFTQGSSVTPFIYAIF